MGHGRSGNQTNNYYSSFIFSGRKCPPIGHARVDSTDPTHQQVTAEQLYTTDVIVYVTDYNHVQSETNLHFLRQLTSEQKPIFLVINQIDKHDEKELSLHAYENSIKTMLDRWNIHPVSIYYTSMKDLDHPANQIEVFNREMKALLYRGEEILSESLSRLAAGTAEALKSRIEEEIEEAKEEWEARLEENDIDPELIRKQESREHRLKTLDGEKKQAIKKLYDDRNSLFENVTLFPYSTTEKARNWLESQDPQFKVGVFL
ncbi:dynamin family protein [Thalassobacillus sp. C254]|uniref:dynamin family protein n=1 Tax=Thalassobacillus sp. C254 TaxID=1225341 RepID=UPI0006CFCC66|nr:dynamin family protein [Thalassobacillus sp. C254]